MNTRRCWVALLLGLLLALPSTAAEFKSATEAVEKGRSLFDEGECAEAYYARAYARREIGDSDNAEADSAKAKELGFRPKQPVASPAERVPRAL